MDQHYFRKSLHTLHSEVISLYKRTRHTRCIFKNIMVNLHHWLRVETQLISVHLLSDKCRVLEACTLVNVLLLFGRDVWIILLSSEQRMCHKRLRLSVFLLLVRVWRWLYFHFLKFSVFILNDGHTSGTRLKRINFLFFALASLWVWRLALLLALIDNLLWICVSVISWTAISHFFKITIIIFNYVLKV